jgi:NitT/TauT family transport system substrate-binding protein
MRKIFGMAIAAAAGAILSFGAAGQAQAATKLALSTWVGYGPLYIAQDEGLFKKYGVEVDLIKMEDPKLRFAALRAGQLDMLVSTVDAGLLYLKAPDDFQYVCAIDDSDGGDGIVANKDITTVAQLKGKKVAVNIGSVSQFYLDVLLAEAGIPESDVQTVNMTAGDAGSAFVAGKVDAAVTWEPWLTRGKQAPQGHLLIDSSKTPGLITDVLIVTKTYATGHEKEVQAIVNAWNDAVAWEGAHPTEAVAIMAKGVGGWLKDPKDFADTLSGVKFYGGPENKTFFGSPGSPGPLYHTTQKAIDVWSSHGKLQVKVTPADVINAAYVNH